VQALRDSVGAGRVWGRRRVGSGQAPFLLAERAHAEEHLLMNGELLGPRRNALQIRWRGGIPLRSNASRNGPFGLCQAESFGNSFADSVSFRFPSWQSLDGHPVPPANYATGHATPHRSLPIRKKNIKATGRLKACRLQRFTRFNRLVFDCPRRLACFFSRSPVKSSLQPNCPLAILTRFLGKRSLFSSETVNVPVFSLVFGCSFCM
jgi:hypothetical protein